MADGKNGLPKVHTRTLPKPNVTKEKQDRSHSANQIVEQNLPTHARTRKGYSGIEKETQDCFSILRSNVIFLPQFIWPSELKKSNKNGNSMCRFE